MLIAIYFQSTEPVSFYAGVYASLCISSIISDFIALASITVGALNAAQIIHLDMLRKIMKSPMRYEHIL